MTEPLWDQVVGFQRLDALPREFSVAGDRLTEGADKKTVFYVSDTLHAPGVVLCVNRLRIGVHDTGEDDFAGIGLHRDSGMR